MKSIINLFLSVTLLFTLSACTEKTEQTSVAVQSSAAPTSTVAPTSTAAPTLTAAPTSTAAPDGTKTGEGYIGNKRSGVFHRPDCETLPKEKNRVKLPSREEALDRGFVPCKKCNP